MALLKPFDGRDDGPASRRRLPLAAGRPSAVTNGGPSRVDNYRPLIVEHEIVSLPSASTLAVQRRELAGRKSAPKSITSD
jgi:hypothetical protein